MGGGKSTPKPAAAAASTTEVALAAAAASRLDATSWLLLLLLPLLLPLPPPPLLLLLLLPSLSYRDQERAPPRLRATFSKCRTQRSASRSVVASNKYVRPLEFFCRDIVSSWKEKSNQIKSNQFKILS
jgi:hypothetical protein